MNLKRLRENLSPTYVEIWYLREEITDLEIYKKRLWIKWLKVRYENKRMNYLCKVGKHDRQGPRADTLVSTEGGELADSLQEPSTG